MKIEDCTPEVEDEGRRLYTEVGDFLWSRRGDGGGSVTAVGGSSPEVQRAYSRLH